MKVHFWSSLLAAAIVLLLVLLPDVGAHLLSSHPKVKASPYSKKVVIMPLGDSITYGEGSTDLSGYRLALWQRLTKAGINVSFVGSMSSGSKSFIDAANEGHPGWRIAQITSHVVGWLRTYKPDYVLLQIGTNAVVYHHGMAQAPARLKTLIDTITNTLPGVTVLVAEITPLAPPREALVEAYNRTIPGIARAEVAEGKHVEAVDMHDAVPLSDLLPDHIHPNNAGYALMANVWYQALYPLLKPSR